MDRCNTCPHWALAEDYALLPVVDGMDRVCALTVSDFNTPATGEAARAESEGDATALYTRADFGCTEHPSRVAFDAARARIMARYGDMFRDLADA